ncbi:hypothetical protein KM043_012877 [Ampulex compressa]|nr:hypothetical protein KM043_012877 [Ampulex compressa]
MGHSASLARIVAVLSVHVAEVSRNKKGLSRHQREQGDIFDEVLISHETIYLRNEPNVKPSFGICDPDAMNSASS